MSTQAWMNHLLWATHAAIVAAIASLVNREVPEPYMDEIFHIGQAKTYCAGRWLHWDPKLTTPPGLYTPSAVLSRYLHLPLCTIPALRSINAVLVAVVLPVLLADLLATIRHGSTRAGYTIRQNFREALTVSAFPLVYFFAFLYYTDVGSLVLVLLSYRQALHRQYISAATLGLVSLSFRQTNIIWVAFIAFEALSAEHGRAAMRAAHSTASKRPRQSRLALEDAVLGSLPRGVLQLLHSCIQDIPTTLRVALPFAPVLFAFLAFVRWNQGIVLGDKTMHIAVLHIPQVYYFTAFAAVMSVPILDMNAKAVKAVGLTIVGTPLRLSVSVVSCLVICWTVKHYTIEHPFLLADNRHYPFYLWRRIINFHPLARYALTPAYLVVAVTLFRSLAIARTWTLLPLVAFIGATALTLVPSPLLEFRYFIVPYILLRLHLRPIRRTQVLLEQSLYVAVNAVTLYVFLYRRFRWPTEDAWQRFMW